MDDVDAVIAGLSGAVAAAPDNHALRLHLGMLLLDRGAARDALDCCTAVLARVPDHLPALVLAEKCARAAGEIARGAAYARLCAALGADRPAPLAERDDEQAGSAPSMAEIVGRVPASSQTEEPTGAPDNVAYLRLVRDQDMRLHGAEVERPAVTLSDVGGMEHVKARLRMAFLAPLANPALRAAFRKSLRGGLLLYGPPGCGKTFIARAVAGELGARFISIGLHDVLDMYIGQGEKNLHAIFENARRTSPCVLFFDEVDAIGRKRTQLRSMRLLARPRPSLCPEFLAARAVATAVLGSRSDIDLPPIDMALVVRALPLDLLL